MYSNKRTTKTDEEHITFSNPHPRASTSHHSNMLSTNPPSPPTTLSVLRSEPGNYHTGALTDTTMHVAPYIPPVPHPSELHAPLPSENPDAYWVVTVGQEVGIFFHWCIASHFISIYFANYMSNYFRLDIGEHTQGISGAIQVRQETWVDALHLYMRKYNEGVVEVRPSCRKSFLATLCSSHCPICPSIACFIHTFKRG
jgi:hypothetical protein